MPFHAVSPWHSASGSYTLGENEWEGDDVLVHPRSTVSHAEGRLSWANFIPETHFKDVLETLGVPGSLFLLPGPGMITEIKQKNREWEGRGIVIFYETEQCLVLGLYFLFFKLPLSLKI